MLMGTYEQACVPWSPQVAPWTLRPGAAAARPRPHRALAGDRLQALPGDGDGGDQAGDQRAVHVRARRQPARRPDPRGPQLLGRVRGDGRPVPGRWRRARPGQLDDRRATRSSTSGGWTSPGSATGPTSPTPTPRCGRTTAGASASRSRTRSCRPGGRCTRRRCTTGSPRTTRCGAPASGSSTRCGSSVPGEEPVEDVTFRRSNAFPVVADECRAVRERVGLTECSNFAKYRVTGPGSAEWLQGLFTNRLPKPGRIALTPDAQPRRPDRRRVLGRPHGRRRVLPVRLADRRGAPLPVVPRPPAGADRRALRGARPVARRAVRGRAARPRRPAVGDDRVARHRRLPVHGVPAGADRDGPGLGRADDLHRRPRLRDLGRARSTSGRCSTCCGTPDGRTAWRCSASGR